MSQQLAVSMLGSPSILLDGSPLVFPIGRQKPFCITFF